LAFGHLVCLASLSEHPVLCAEHELGERLTLADGRHALELEKLLLTSDLNFLRSSYLRVELGLKLLATIF
jgi:hypothetical protein